MTNLRVLSIFGTRPEAVKMAPVVLQLAKTPGIDSQVCVTAQHRQMLDQVLEMFKITPDFDLDLMQPHQSLAQITAAIFTHLDPVLKSLQPDWILAQGDTTTVMATALLAYYNRIRFGHVEAGLRTGDKWQPFPEELNRIGLEEIPKAGEPRLILVTAHRRENFGAPLESICAALATLAETYKKSLRIVYPVHLNPNVQEPAHR